MSSITASNQTISNISTRYIFQRVFLGKILAILPICIMKKSIWKFHVNGIISVTGTHVNVYQILVGAAVMLWVNHSPCSLISFSSSLSDKTLSHDSVSI